MTTKINLLAIGLAKGSFQVWAVGPEGRVWMPPVWQAISSVFRRGLRPDVCQASECGLPCRHEECQELCVSATGPVPI